MIIIPNVDNHALRSQATPPSPLTAGVVGFFSSVGIPVPPWTINQSVIIPVPPWRINQSVIIPVPPWTINQSVIIPVPPWTINQSDSIPVQPYTDKQSINHYTSIHSWRSRLLLISQHRHTPFIINQSIILFSRHTGTNLENT